MNTAVMMKRPLWLLVVVLLGAWALLTLRIGAPWFGHHDANGAWISNAVRNYQRYGILNVGGMVITNAAPTTPDRYNYYTNHPPLMEWIMALPVLLAGYDEALLRFVAAGATLIGIAAFYALCRRLYGRRRAFWAAAFYAFTPMIAYFGRMPDHEAIALPLVFLFALALVDWLRAPTPVRWIVLALLAWGAAWTAWAGVILVGTLCLCALWYTLPQDRLAVVALLALTGLAVIALLAYYQSRSPGALQTTLNAFLWRTSDQSLLPGSPPFTWGEFIVKHVLRLIPLVTPTILLLALIGVSSAWRDSSRLGRGILLAFGAAGVGYLLIFRNAAFIHDYYSIYLMPSIAILAASAVTRDRRHEPSRRILRPLLAALLLVTPVPLLYNLYPLHQSGEQTEPMTIALGIKARTQPDDLILSNVPTIGPAIDFYAERDIFWETPVETALARSREGSQAVFYLHCANDYADVFADYTREKISEQCWLTRLSR